MTGVPEFREAGEPEESWDYYDCPECGFPVCSWCDCPECGWYDAEAWEAVLDG